MQASTSGVASSWVREEIRSLVVVSELDRGWEWRLNMHQDSRKSEIVRAKGSVVGWWYAGSDQLYYSDATPCCACTLKERRVLAGRCETVEIGNEWSACVR